MQKFKQTLKDIWTDESGAAATEYIFLLVIIVAVATIFKDQIRDAISTKMGDVSSQITGFSGQ